MATSAEQKTYTLWFEDLNSDDLPQVGGLLQFAIRWKVSLVKKHLD